LPLLKFQPSYLTDRVAALSLVSYFQIQIFFFRLDVSLLCGTYRRYRCGLVRSAL